MCSSDGGEAKLAQHANPDVERIATMKTIRRVLTTQAMVLVALTLALPTVRGGAARASAFATLYNFQGGSDGSSPNGVVLGRNGALYGTTNLGGPNTCEGSASTQYLCGTVFELAPAKGAAWTKTVLHNFKGPDGAAPGASLVFGDNGALYGTTLEGGSNDAFGAGFGGTVFELAPPAIAGGVWTEAVLYSLNHSTTPPNTATGGLLMGPGGALYATAFDQGTTPGEGCGSRTGIHAHAADGAGRELDTEHRV